MSNTINFGVSPYRTVLSINRVNSLLADNMERLSSGLRVNRAADDPSGLAVATKLASKDSSASAALRNSASRTKSERLIVFPFCEKFFYSSHRCFKF